MTIGSSRSRYSPGVIAGLTSAICNLTSAISSSAYRLVNGHQLGAVGERALDLNLGNHRRDPVHHRAGVEHRRAEAHDLGDGPAVADHLEDLGGDQRDRLRMIQFQTARAPLARQLAGRKDQELVDFARGEVHRAVMPHARREVKTGSVNSFALRSRPSYNSVTSALANHSEICGS